MNNKRIEYIQKKYPKLSPETIQKLSSIDPTQEKKYLVWLANLYSKTELSNEQMISAGLLLESFNENKNKIPLEKRDLNKFSDLLELATFLMSFERESRKSEESFLKNGIRKVFENEKWLIAVPLTLEASIKLGKGTTWCTSSTDGSWNRFHSYAGRGDLFVVINKELAERTKTKKHQLFFDFKGSSSECTNSMNQNINIVKFLKENKEVFNALSTTESFKVQIEKNSTYFSLLESPTEQQMINAVSRNPNLIKDFKEYSEDVADAYLSYYSSCDSEDFSKKFKTINKFGERYQLIAVKKNPNLIKHIQKAYEVISKEVQLEAVEQKASIIKYINKPHREAINMALSEVPELIKIIEKPTKKQQLEVVENKPKLIKFIKNPWIEVKIEAIKQEPSLYKGYSEKLKDSDIIEIIKESPTVLKFISEPSEEMQHSGVDSNYEVIKHIKSPTKKVKALATRRKKAANKLEREREERWERERERKSERIVGRNKWGDYIDTGYYDGYDSHYYRDTAASSNRKYRVEDMIKEEMLKEFLIWKQEVKSKI